MNLAGAISRWRIQCELFDLVVGGEAEKVSGYAAADDVIGISQTQRAHASNENRCFAFT